MCGIAGFLSPANPEQIKSTVQGMLQTLLRRGPDSGGYEAWNGVGLGHRRLAILDLSEAGHQPMLSEDRSIGVVFNGCIYNFLDLRAELEKAGFRFRSDCDTEVLVHGYQHWGIEELTCRLHGMFAFGVWDEPRRTLSLVRDRLGVKPLLYSQNGSTLAFGSTAAAIRATGLHGEIDPAAVLQYLDIGNVSGSQSIYGKVHKLPPGTILQWKAGQLTEQRYWNLPNPGQASLQIGFDEAVEETERLLIEATRLRLISDVPIASLLSGGVDSTLVCWALSRLNSNVTAFTVGARGDQSDETEYALQTARHLGIPHEVVELPPDRPEMLGEIADAFSEPFASPSAQAMLRVSKTIRSRATVLLTGDGGDDVFLGYPFFYYAWTAQRIAHRLPALSAPMLRGLSGMLPAQGVLRRIRNFLGYTSSGLGAFIAASGRLDFYQRYGIFGEQLRDVTLAQYQLTPSLESARKLLPEFLELFYDLHFEGEFLPKVDGATMYYSLESRSPLLDQKLWEFAAQLPPELLLHGGTLKAVLRKIVGKHINLDTATRRKQGFTVPVERWLASEWTSSLDVLKGPTELERQGWIRPGSLAKPIEDARQSGQAPKQLWHLLLLEHWLAHQTS